MAPFVRPVPGVPILRLGPRAKGEGVWLAIADLHLGLGASEERPLGPPGATAADFASVLAAAAADQHAHGIVVVGDAKHPIVGVPPPLRRTIFEFFGELLSLGLEVDLVPGNHDVGIERHLPREVVVHPSSGVVRNGVGLFHGHRWPSEKVLSARRLVTGHMHPGVRFAPSAREPRGKQRSWLRIDLSRAVIAPPGGKRAAAREMIVLPAFNPVAGTEALNRERPGRGRTFLYRRFVLPGESRAYLLDGTDVGPVTWKPAGLPRASP